MIADAMINRQAIFFLQNVFEKISLDLCILFADGKCIHDRITSVHDKRYPWFQLLNMIQRFGHARFRDITGLYMYITDECKSKWFFPGSFFSK